MKKLVLLLVSLVFFSCSKNDDVDSISLVSNWQTVEYREMYTYNGNGPEWGNWFVVEQSQVETFSFLNATECKTVSNYGTQNGTYVYDEVNQKITVNFPEADFPTIVYNVISIDNSTLILQYSIIDSTLQIKYTKI
jgi:hypothetical protein